MPAEPRRQRGEECGDRPPPVQRNGNGNERERRCQSTDEAPRPRSSRMPPEKSVRIDERIERAHACPASRAITGASVARPDRPPSIPPAIARMPTSLNGRRSGESSRSSPRIRARSIATARRVSSPRCAIRRSPSSFSSKFQSEMSDPPAASTRARSPTAATSSAMPTASVGARSAAEPRSRSPSAPGRSSAKLTMTPMTASGARMCDRS